ncbi:MAG TPA: hypothetical protein P5513_03385 [Candidatus Diapherotrites archaeon]|nr:hypothetical protein [Candidatus Diapherotrites archaeon]
MPVIDQIEIRRGTPNGSIETTTYNIGVGNADAIDVNYDDTVTQLGVSNVQRAIEQLKANFQTGVDLIVEACEDKGSTPAGQYPYTPQAVADAIDAIQTGITPTGTYVYDGTEAPSWIANVYNYAEADASYVYNKGYSDGDAFSIREPKIIRSFLHNNPDVEIIIPATPIDILDFYIENNTDYQMKIMLYGVMGGTNPGIDLNDTPLPSTVLSDMPYGIFQVLPAHSTLHFHQSNGGSASNSDKIFMAVMGGYNSYTNTLVTDPADLDHGTTGTFEFN